jgi:hypothetical protein
MLHLQTIKVPKLLAKLCPAASDQVGLLTSVSVAPCSASPALPESGARSQ